MTPGLEICNHSPFKNNHDFKKKLSDLNVALSHLKIEEMLQVMIEHFKEGVQCQFFVLNY
jgi:hypothetical protein